MRQGDAVKVAHQLTRYKRMSCKKPHSRGFFVKQTLIPLCTRAEKKIVGDIFEARRCMTRTIWVRLDKLRAMQSCLGRPRLVYQLRHYPLKRQPHVLALPNGLFAIWDGHHRATAGVMLGKVRIKCQEMRI